MFDIFAKLLSSIASFLFPLFASYKALNTSDPAQLTPWLMYWVVLACALLVESWTEWFLVWIPFYAYIRLLFLLYLVLPQTQGARIIYTTHIHPWLEDNEGAIEEFIASAHERLRAAGIAYIKRAIDLLKTNVLGMPPSPSSESTNTASGYGGVGGGATQEQQSYTQALLARFSLPSARWSGSGRVSASGAGGGGADFYSFLASAVSAAANAAATSASTARGGAPPAGDGEAESAAETLVPANIRGTTARMSFIAAQRERLAYVLSALDREASQLQSQSETEARMPSTSLEGGGVKMRSMSGHSSSGSDVGYGSSGRLSKSRSEADFEKLEAESGAEEDMGVDGMGMGGSEGTGSGGIGLRRRAQQQQHQQTTPNAAAGGGSWMPWGWGGGNGGGGSATPPLGAGEI